jgi:hypothetical protein
MSAIGISRQNDESVEPALNCGDGALTICPLLCIRGVVKSRAMYNDASRVL